MSQLSHTVSTLPACRFPKALLGAIILVLTFHSADVSEARETALFDFGWKFHLGAVEGASNPSFDDASWRTLDLPHDWSIEGSYDQGAPTGGSGGYLPTGLGWYRKSFALPDTDRGQQVLVQFDGVYEDSTVWINGHELGTRPYGYSSFVYDLTPYVAFGPAGNVIAVRVDNTRQPNSRWYSGSGIFRHTWITTVDPMHIAPWGVCVRTPEVSADWATVVVTTHVVNRSSASRQVVLRTEVLDGAGMPVPPAAGAGADANLSDSTPCNLGAGAEQDVESRLTLAKPRLWSPGSPGLYRIRSQVLVEGVVADSMDTPFGVRRIEYDVDKGLLVNGIPTKLKGMCIHHDGGAVGSAVPEALLERRLRLLVEMGCNAIRCSHNPEAPEFYDICDRLGLLVLDEAFDEWTVRKPQLSHGYSDSFSEWYARDLADFIRRDRNHPSVIMWSAGNEIGDQTTADGPEVLKRLIDIFHREDPTRPVTVAMDNIFNQNGEAPDAFTRLLDVVGYNYVDRWGARRETQYSDDRARYPKRRFLGTEESGVPSVRGDYPYGPLLDLDDSDDQPTFGKGPLGPQYVAATIRAASLWRFVALHDYVIGQFVWTGFDYLGESAWPRKLTAFGALDTCGFKKDSFYFYQSLWTDRPMVHILPNWSAPGSGRTVVPVVAYTNCAAVELFLNGRSLGAKAREFPSQGVTQSWKHYDRPKIAATTSDFQLVWDVAYEAGELKAVGYNATGEVVATDSEQTAQSPSSVELTVDRQAIAAGNRDVAAVTVRVLDSKGVWVPTADSAVTFRVSGPGTLIGVDNGDPVDHASYKGSVRRLFNGMALGLVQSTGGAGIIHVTAESPGLTPASLDIEASAP